MPGGSIGSVGGAQQRSDVRQVLALRAPADQLDHLRLDVLGVHDAVRADAAGELDREPAAARPEIGDDGAVGDPSVVHDQFGRLPLIAIGRFEQPEILRREQAVLCALAPADAGRWALGGRRRQATAERTGPRARSAAPRRRDGPPFDPASPAPSRSLRLLPAAQPDRRPAARHRVGREDAVEPSASSRPRSSTRSRIDRPVFTDSLASSAVAA